MQSANDLAESLFFTGSRALALGFLRLRPDAQVSRLEDTPKFLLPTLTSSK